MEEQELLNGTLVDEQFLADLPHRRKRPTWILKEPIISVGAWEPLFHRRRVGASWVEDEKFYAYEHSEQFVKEILEVGGNLLITAFDKNYHIDDEEFLLKKKLARICKKHGLRLATYIRPDQIYSEVFATLLRKEDLLSTQADHRVSTYGNQEWRERICFHKPKLMEMLKKNIRRAVVDLGVDALFFDGLEVGGVETHGACRCKNCRQDFTKFLKRRYGDDSRACRRRFGHTHIEAIEPPGLTAIPSVPSGMITNPVWQEWIIFRCTWTTRVVREISEYVYQLNPEVAIIANNGVQAKENLALMQSADLVSLGKYLDILINESGYHPRITDEGCIIQQAREYKMTLETGCFGWTHVDTYGSTPYKLRVEMAHAAAFNRGRVTEFGHAFSCYGDFRRLADIKKFFAQWLKNHWEHFQNLEEVEDVTVWRERKTMAFSAPITYATAMQVEQLLIEDRVPFTVIQKDWPASSRVIVLPNLTCLDENNCQKIIKFVKGGGGVLVVGGTSSQDGWGRRRTDFGLRPILPEDICIPELSFAQHIAGADVPIQPGKEKIVDAGIFKYHRVGKGRVVYVSSLVDPTTQPSPFNPDHTFNFEIDFTNWRVPEKADELRRALAWLADNRYSLQVESVRGVIANYYRQSESGNYYIHLVNLTGQVVANTFIKFEFPGKSKVKKVSAISPDGDNFRKIDWRVSGDNLMVSLERLDVHTVIIVSIQS